MDARQIQRRMFILLAVCCALAISGCQIFPDKLHQPLYHNPFPQLLPNGAFTPTTVLRTERAALGRWLAPASGQALEDHLYVVDPSGDWMMRVPVDPDPARLKRDIDKLLRASAGWDRPGR